MDQNKKEKKSLKLNKETLMRLQEEQLKAAIGGAAMMSTGQSSQCPTVDTCGCNPNEPVSCCRKSCRDGGGHKDLV